MKSLRIFMSAVAVALVILLFPLGARTASASSWAYLMSAYSTDNPGPSGNASLYITGYKPGSPLHVELSVQTQRTVGGVTYQDYVGIERPENSSVTGSVSISPLRNSPIYVVTLNLTFKDGDKSGKVTGTGTFLEMGPSHEYLMGGRFTITVTGEIQTWGGDYYGTRWGTMTNVIRAPAPGWIELIPML